MLEKFKNMSLISKILYLIAIILFIAWVIPMMSSYYSSVNKYEQNTQELKSISEKYGINTTAKIFSEALFKKEAELLFSKVSIKNLGDKKYLTNISIKREDLKTFHTFIASISLKYYVKIHGDLDFTMDDTSVNVKMTLEAL
ncbi:MAG: Unknown protein [uncultured Sulfurovum sp.]|uniref:Uncharacterized protein n=1 Tax=uncultured Sulfurovum sp. TaxID=269237 RepID=A0A6S6T7W6_9BACT|nr:MAG: Unknown protein [uncultured Sulfurovum sp.]